MDIDPNEINREINFTLPTDEAMIAATRAIHHLDCEVVGCGELNTTGRYAQWGFAAAFAIANLGNPDVTPEVIAEQADTFRHNEIRKASGAKHG